MVPPLKKTLFLCVSSLRGNWKFRRINFHSNAVENEPAVLKEIPPPPGIYYSRCSFSMMVKWANDGTLQANDGKILVNDGEMPINDSELSVWSYTHFTIIDKHFTIITSSSPSLTSILPSLAWSRPSFAHLTIIEKLPQLIFGYIIRLAIRII